MFFNWRKFLDIGRFLHESGKKTSFSKPNCDEFYRSSISRYYFAALNEAANKSSVNPLLASSETDYQEQVIKFFKSSSNPEYRFIGNTLEQLYRRRYRSDYIDAFPVVNKISLERASLDSEQMAEYIINNL